jgi:predicted nucleic acid-binding protein
MRIIVDTSVWVDFLNGSVNFQSQKLKQLIKDDEPVYLLPVIIQEILQGIRSDANFENILNILDGFPVITFDPIQAAIGAARLYRDLREKGITIRKSNDCLIAYVAIMTDSEILYKDRDFDLIAAHSSLKVAL